MIPPPRELEIKLELTSQQMRRARARLGSASSAPVTETLVSSYFDTADRSLRAAGLSLRVRRLGDRRVQTLKADKAVSGGVSNPIEIETDIDGDEPAIEAIDDKRFRRQLKRLLPRDALIPLFSTEIERTWTRVATGAGDDVEVALDVGHVRAGSQSLALSEVEIELKAGRPSALLALARDIIDGGPVRPSALSKADRGYRMLDAAPGTPHAARSQVPQIEPGMTSHAAICEICRIVTLQILHNWQVLAEHDDIEAAHQLRVGLRRLRAALRIVRSIADDDGLRELDTGARDLGRAVGRLRDLDVLVTEIIAPLATMDHVGRGIAIVRRRIAAEKKALRKEVLAELEGTGFGMLRLKLGLLPHLVGQLAEEHAKQLERPVEDLAPKALRQLQQRILKRGRDLSKLTVEQRHTLRKSIKPLRYGMEFFAPLYPRTKVKRLLVCAGELQTKLGYLNDVALAQSLQTLDWKGTPRAGEAMQAIGAVVGWHAARFEQAWGDVKSTWRCFERAATFLD